MFQAARILFAGTLLLAPWLFGGTEAYLLPWIAWPLVASFLLMAIAWVTSGDRQRLAIPLLALPVLLGAAWGGFQLAPLFESGATGPAAVQLRAQLALEPPAAKVPLSLSPAATRRQIAWLAMAAAVLLLSANLFATPNLRRLLLAALTINGALLAVVSILQVATWQGQVYWIGPEVTGRLPAVGPFVYHNQAGAYFATCGACLVGWALASRTIGQRTMQPVQVAVGICLLGGLLASYSRGALLATLAAGAVSAVIAGRGFHLRKLATVAALLITGAIGLVWLTSATDQAEARLASLTEQTTYQQDGRIQHWPVALRAARQVGIMGGGLGAYKPLNPLFEHRSFSRVFERAHNQYLETLVDGGVIAVALLGIAIGIAIRMFGRASSSTETSLAAVGTAGIVALVFQILHGLIDFCLYLPANLLLMAALAGLVVLPRPRTDGGHYRDSSIPASASSWRGLLLLASLAVAVVYSGLVLNRQATLDRALRLFPWRSIDAQFSRSSADQLVRQLITATNQCPDDGEAWQALGEALVLRYRVMARDAIAQEFDVAVDNPELWELTKPSNLLSRATLFRSQADTAQLAELRTDEVIVDNLPAAWDAYRNANGACPLLPRPVQRLYELRWLNDKADQLATNALARLVRLAPHDAQRLFEIGSLAYLTDEKSEAIEPWRMSLAIEPLLARQIVPLASAVLTPEQMLAQLLPDDPDALYEIAIYALREPQVATLRELSLQRAVNLLSPSEPVAATLKADQLRQLGRLHAGLMNHRQASEAYAVAVKKRPTEAQWRSEYAEQLAAQGLLDEAEKQAVAAVRLRPAVALYQRQLKLIRAGRGGAPAR